MHTLIDLRGSIPKFIFITDGKYHDSNALDVLNFYAKAIYLMESTNINGKLIYRPLEYKEFMLSGFEVK